MISENAALLLLASGESNRFGPKNKLLAILDGKPLIEHVIDNAAPVKFKARYAVVSRGDVAQILRSRGFQVIFNDNSQDGQGHALSLGAKAVKTDDIAAACVMLADMPFVGVDHIERLFQNLGEYAAVFSAYDGIAMPPAIFTGAAFGRLSTAGGDTGAKNFLGAETSKLCELSKRAAMDIDTPADLAAARLLV